MLHASPPLESPVKTRAPLQVAGRDKYLPPRTTKYAKIVKSVKCSVRPVEDGREAAMMETFKFSVVSYVERCLESRGSLTASMRC
jgi:hypothetical protein